MKLSLTKIVTILFGLNVLTACQSSQPVYKSYQGLVMAGYQGWFTAEGDGADRGFHHYRGANGFKPGSASIDFWPDMAEYTRKYETEFKFADGTPAFVYSAYDEETIDLHFKWMKEYHIDGVFMQRFVGEIKREKGKRHFNKVLESALKAAKKYNRAISVMYDLSGCKPEDLLLIDQDWDELQQLFSLSDVRQNPTFLHHNGKPLMSLWGIGFNDGRKYSVEDVEKTMYRLKEKNLSVMLGVPYYWRILKHDAVNSEQLHSLIKQADVIMPWAVNRYKAQSYSNEVAKEDVKWCEANQVDYAPLVFPGFSWGNLKRDAALYNESPRLGGAFLWKQIAGAKAAGAQMLYVAMFDEVDEGTAIFKCATEDHLPLNGEGKFVGIEKNLPTDHYLWLTGQAAKWFKGKKGYSEAIPVR